MGKASQKNSKYVIKAEMEAGGFVEKPDVVGAIFGQTEGLLEEDLNLRELQERGRIGRIQVNVKNKENTSEAEVRIPSSLNAADTSIIAASLETIERVGPSSASIKVNSIKDVRVSKREYVRKRAKQLLSDIKEERPDKATIEKEIKEEVRKSQITEYKEFDSGPKAEASDTIILLEGRADLERLLKFGLENGVAIGGSSVPSAITEVAEGKSVTAFLDGDRGAKLILEELKEKIDLDKVARAPEGKEVEELPKKKIFEALRDREKPQGLDKNLEPALSEEIREKFREKLDELLGSRGAVALNEELDQIQKVPADKLEQLQDSYAVVMDGEADRENIEQLEGKTRYLIARKKSDRATSEEIELYTEKGL